MKLTRLLAATMTVAVMLSTATAAMAAEAATRQEVAQALVSAADDYNPGVATSDILKGDPNGDLRLEDPVKRSEALVMLQRAFGAFPAAKGDSARKGYPAASFTDVPNWAKEELSSVFASGIVAGTSETTFSPNDPVTMEQMELFLHRTYSYLGTNLKDDFYATINKTWLDNSTIKPGYTISGTLYDLMYDTQPLTNIINKAVSNPQSEDEKRIAALYNNVLDWDARNAAGITPIKAYLDGVDQAATLNDLMAVRHKMVEELGGGMLIGFNLSMDMKDSNKYTVGFSTFAPSLTKEIYTQDSGAQKDAYLTYVQTLLEIAGQDSASAKADALRFWNFEKAVSPSRLDPQDQSNVDKIYNVYTMEQLQALFPNVNLQEVYKDTGLAPSAQIIVGDVGLMETAAGYFDDAHVSDLKLLMKVSLLSAYGSYLSRDFEDASYAYQQAFLGAAGTATDEETATQAVQQLLTDELGHLYAKTYFSPEAKADVEDMVKDFIAVYREKLQNNTWMSAATKAKAIEKLDTMGVKVGYPDDGQWTDAYKGLTLKTADQGGSYFDNVVALNKANRDLMVEWQKAPVDKGMWAMSPYTVNACYVGSFNEIQFPAGILQAPMYDVKASREANLGGIGYIIAHEITHAFDNNGAKFDKDGNATDWWTAEDYAAFQKLCDEVVAAYDGVESAPGITCNGTLTLSENIADLGAASCILQVAKQEANPDLETMFRAMANTWASTMNRETAVYFTQIDVHAPDKLRGMIPLQSLDEFYTTFGIQEGDGMYVAPADRVSIW